MYNLPTLKVRNRNTSSQSTSHLDRSCKKSNYVSFFISLYLEIVECISCKNSVTLLGDYFYPSCFNKSSNTICISEESFSISSQPSDCYKVVAQPELNGASLSVEQHPFSLLLSEIKSFYFLGGFKTQNWENYN